MDPGIRQRPGGEQPCRAGADHGGVVGGDGLVRQFRLLMSLWRCLRGPKVRRRLYRHIENYTLQNGGRFSK
jgi:hypothetical protein